MTASRAIVRVLGAEQTAAGLFCRVLLADGSETEVEAALVPAAVKQAFIAEVQQGNATGRAAQAGTSDRHQALLDDIGRRGAHWVERTMQALAQLGSRYHEVERRAQMAGRFDLAAHAAMRREEVRKARDAFTVIAYEAFPEYFTDVGALPVIAGALLLALTVLVGLNIVATNIADSFVESRSIESAEFLRALEMVPPDQRAPIVADRFEPQAGFWDTAGKSLLIMGVGYAVSQALPPIIAALKGRRG